MTITNLKELEKLVKLCRKNGIKAITIDGITMSIDLPTPRRKLVKDDTAEVFPEAEMQVPAYNPPDEPVTADRIETDELTEEQLMFYSSATTESAEVQ